MIFVHPHPRFNVYREFMAPPVSSPSRVVRGSGNQDDDFPDFVPAGKYPKKATMESEASVQLGFHDFSDNSSLCNLEGAREKVAQVKIAHAGKPSLLFKHTEVFVEFLEYVHAQDSRFPATLKDFEKRFVMRFVMGPDPPAQSQVAYALGCYMKVSAMGVFVDIFETYLAWRLRSNRYGPYPAITIDVYNSTNAEVEVKAGTYECAVIWHKAEATSAIPFGPFAIPGPAWSKLHAAVEIHAIGDTVVKMRFVGDTLLFKHNFTAINIPGRYEDGRGNAFLPEKTDKTEKTYVRVIKSVDVGDENKKQFVLGLFKDLLYEGTLVQVVWHGACKKSTPVSELKQEVGDLSNVSLSDVI
jgi:hypothetical protein